MEGLENVAQISDVAASLLLALDEPFDIGEHELYVNASMGISVYPTDADTAEGIIKNADAAMYLAKDRGRGNYQFFTAELHERAHRRLGMASHLHRASKRGELRLVYQPQISVADGRVVGAEALLRWDSAELGAVPTAEFIQVAEETGLIVGVGEWVLQNACAHIRQWAEAGLPPLRVAVNISATQVEQEGFERFLRELIVESGIQPSLLELELTERILLADPDAAIGVLAGINRMGVRLSIDDFGTGYSSLSYLHRLPLDQLKVAREFIPSRGESGGQSVARSIVSLAKSLGLECTVEGVETHNQLALCTQWGCDTVQGYLYSRPLPLGAFEDFVHRSLTQNAPPG